MLICYHSQVRGEIFFFLSYQAFFIQQLQNAHFCFNQVNNLLIVIKIDQSPRDIFLHIFFLFQFEDMLGRIQKLVQSKTEY